MSLTAIDPQAQAIRREFCRAQGEVDVEARRHFARHPRTDAEMRLFWIRRAEYVGRVLAHDDPRWWMARAHLNPATDDWLAEKCVGCGGRVVGWFAETQQRQGLPVCCNTCYEFGHGLHPSQSELDRKAVAV
jgi:hypothetical protein